MKEKIILGENDNSIEVTTRISLRARKIAIRISNHKGVELIIPKRINAKTAIQFLYSKEEWIRSKISLKPKNIGFFEGVQIPIHGNLYTIFHNGKLRGITQIDGNNLIVSGPEGSTARKVKKFLHDLAKKEIETRAQIEAAKLGVKYNRITIRDTTSRWGSCSAQKTLSFSWRLILAPKTVLEYVVAHEVAHLLQMNHSQKFWDIVEKICPEYKIPFKWLKDNGVGLHRFG